MPHDHRGPNAAGAVAHAMHLGHGMRWVTLLAAGFLVSVAAAAQAQSCDALGGDADGDGICDDGSGSGVIGDLPCSCQPPAPPACVVGCDDNCAFAPNPDQLDVGRVGDPDVPDGIGDACQCLDVSDEGSGNVLDAVLLRRALFPLPPPLPAPQKCLGPGPVSCDPSDVSALRDTLAGLASAPANVCLAAGACAGGAAECPAGLGCDAIAQRCEKFPGQACVQADQCLSNACCSDVCRDVTTDVANCGSCGTACTNPHGATTCVEGVCSPSCSSGFDSCDGNPVNGCETQLNTLANCGACNTPCDLANATESCFTGACRLTSCAFPYNNCDGNEQNGCEVPPYSNQPPGENLGSFPADSNSGFLCPAQPCAVVTSKSGATGRYFQASAAEASACGGHVGMDFWLDLFDTPADYDLVVTGKPADCFCEPSDCRSANAGTTYEYVLVWCIDESFEYDGFSVNVEVRHRSGSSCMPWTLEVSAGGCAFP